MKTTPDPLALGHNNTGAQAIFATNPADPFKLLKKRQRDLKAECHIRQNQKKSDNITCMPMKQVYVTSPISIYKQTYKQNNAMCTVYKILYHKSHIADCALHIAQFKLHNAHCTLHNTNGTLHTEYYSLHTAHCTMHTAHCTLHTERKKVGAPKLQFIPLFTVDKAKVSRG